MAAGQEQWHATPMNSALFLIAGFALLAVGLGAVVVYIAMRAAPEGFEDSEGFHAVTTGAQGESAVSTDHPHPEVVSIAA